MSEAELVQDMINGVHAMIDAEKEMAKAAPVEAPK